MQTVIHIESLREAVDDLRRSGPVALVTTMGALHEGHLALVRAAKAQARHVVVSIFVNPRQFGANEDLATYPRPLAEDQAKLAAAGVALLWAPDAATMYPAGYATNVSVSGVSADLCGAARPGHFDGVATIVLKLFNQVQPDIALFGEKDWQQLAVIRRMARDHDLTLPAADAILAVPTVRQADGLAMSSRNAYLSQSERVSAAQLNRAMRAAVARIEGGGVVAEALAALEQSLLAAGFLSVDYASLADAESLALLAETPRRAARLLVAARIGTTRLIDNMAVGGKDQT